MQNFAARCRSQILSVSTQISLDFETFDKNTRCCNRKKTALKFDIFFDTFDDKNICDVCHALIFGNKHY